jgi:hypothetical protein
MKEIKQVIELLGLPIWQVGHGQFFVLSTKWQGRVFDLTAYGINCVGNDPSVPYFFSYARYNAPCDALFMLIDGRRELVFDLSGFDLSCRLRRVEHETDNKWFIVDQRGGKGVALFKLEDDHFVRLGEPLPCWINSAWHEMDGSVILIGQTLRQPNRSYSSDSDAYLLGRPMLARMRKWGLVQTDDLAAPNVLADLIASPLFEPAAQYYTNLYSNRKLGDYLVHESWLTSFPCKDERLLVAGIGCTEGGDDERTEPSEYPASIDYWALAFYSWPTMKFVGGLFFYQMQDVVQGADHVLIYLSERKEARGGRCFLSSLSVLDSRDIGFKRPQRLNIAGLVVDEATLLSHFSVGYSVDIGYHALLIVIPPKVPSRIEQYVCVSDDGINWQVLGKSSDFEVIKLE